MLGHLALLSVGQTDFFAAPAAAAKLKIEMRGLVKHCLAWSLVNMKVLIFAGFVSDVPSLIMQGILALPHDMTYLQNM